MSTSRKLALGSAARVSHVMLVTLVGFFMMPFLVGEMGERWYGIWVAVGSLVASYYLIDFGLASAVTRFVTLSVSTKNDDGVNQVINTALRVYLTLSLLLLLITAILVVAVPWIMDDPGDVTVVRHVLAIVGLTLALGFPFKAFAGIGQAHNRYDLLTLINIAGLIAQVSGTVAVIYAGHGILGLAYVGLASNMLTDVLLFTLVRHLFPALSLSQTHFRKGLVRELFTYSSWTFVTQIAEQVRLRIDALVVAALLNATAVTHYFVGARLAELASNLLYQATNLVTPLMTRFHAQGRHADLQDAVIFLTRINIAAGVFVSGALFVLGKAFIERWMGSEFLDTMPVLFTLTAAFSAAFIVNPLDNLLYAVAKHKVLALINVGDAAAKLALSFVLGTIYGLWGVALGTLVPMLVSRFLFVVPYACKQAALPVSRYLRETFGSLAVAVSLLGLLAYAVHPWTAGAGYPRLIILGAAMAVSYAAAAWMLVLRSTDRSRILSIVRKSEAVQGVA